MPRTKASDWKARAIEDWNVTTFHAYLIDRNREDYNAEYVPFGRGSIQKRWSTEKGQLKQAITKHGNEATKAFIDKCFESHRFNPDFPTLSFGFMWSYLRDNMARAEVELRKQKKREESARKSQEIEVDEEWF